MPLRRKPNGIVLALLAVLLLTASPLYALPEFLLRLARDPFARPELRTQCGTCHIDPQGSGPRNPFGSAFERNDHLVTPEFRQAWPDHFLPSVSTQAVPTEHGEVKATLLSNDQDVILEIDGQQYRFRPKLARLEKIEAAEAAQMLEAPPPAPPAAREPKLPLRSQPTFGHELVNMPTALPYERHSLSMRFTHRFFQPVFDSGIGDLYGFDSFSFSSMGGAFGVTRRLAATVYRSPQDKTIEMGGVLQLLRQEGREPFSAALRVSVEGRNNFQDAYTTNLVLPVSRTISNIAEVFVVPQVSFNSNPFASSATPFDPEGQFKKHMGAVGVGASIRFRPRTAFVVEWTPRVAGFRGRNIQGANSRNVYSFGILRSTNRHVFELVLTNTLGTTTNRSVTEGGKDFTLGFNLYRRLR